MVVFMTKNREIVSSAGRMNSCENYVRSFIPVTIFPQDEEYNYGLS